MNTHPPRKNTQPAPIAYPSSDWGAMTATVGDTPRFADDTVPLDPKPPVLRIDTRRVPLWHDDLKDVTQKWGARDAAKAIPLYPEPGLLERATNWFAEAPLAVVGGIALVLVAVIALSALYPWGFALPFPK